MEDLSGEDISREDISREDISDAAPRVGAALADVLKRDREVYNARFAQAKRRWRQLETQAFSAHLAENLSPIIDAVQMAQPARVDRVVQELYALSLKYVARNGLGPKSRQPHLNLLWRECLPRLTRCLSEEPSRVASTLSLGAQHIGGSKDGGRALVWMRRLVEVAETCENECADFETLLDVGKVLAWRCGMAHYRESALEVWRTLGDELRYQSLVLGPSAEGARVENRWLDEKTRPSLDELDAAFANPWFHPAKDTPDEVSIRTLGGFVGFGHEFGAPPRVLSSGEKLFAVDGSRWFRIFADSFGMLLQPVQPQRREAPALSDGALHRLEVFKQAAFAREPNLENATSLAMTSSTLALTIPHSHRIFLVS